MRFIPLALLLLVSGCGSVAVMDEEARRATTFSTCRSIGFPETITQSLIMSAREDREFGFSFNEVLNDGFDGCAGEGIHEGGCSTNPNLGPDFTEQQCVAGCITCLSAVINQVYAE